LQGTANIFHFNNRPKEDSQCFSVNLHLKHTVQAILLLPLGMLFTLTIKFVWDSIKPKARNLVSFTGTLFVPASSSHGNPEITQESIIGNCGLLLDGRLSDSLKRERERERKAY
jgi:hypothetical protein